MEWIMNNLSTIVIGVIFLIIMALVIRSIVKERRQGGCGCGCPGCNGSCPHSAMNHKNAEEMKK